MIDKRPLTIAVNASVLDQRPTGIGIYARNIINTLQRCSSSRLKYKVFTACAKDIFVNSNMEMRSLPRYVQPYPYKKLAGVFRFFWNQAIYPFAASDCDVLYSLTPHCTLFSRKQVITIHDLLGIIFPRQHRLQYYYYQCFLKFLVYISKSLIIITDSESTKNDIVRYLKGDPGNIHVVYPGYDAGMYSYRNDAQDVILNKYGLRRFIFTVGATYPHKNIERLLRAYDDLNPHLKSQYPLIIGGGRTSHVLDLQRYIADNHMDSANIRFIEYIPQEDLPFFYSAASVFVYPSLYEGFGLPPLEAMACDCPVIASKVSSIPEVCGDAAFYIDPNDVETISRAMAEVLQNDVLRQQLRAKGRDRVKMFSWEKAAGEITGVLKKAAS